VEGVNGANIMEIKIYSNTNDNKGIVKAVRENGRRFSKKEAVKLSRTAFLYYPTIGLYMAVAFI
jgi:hypothetical protein